MEVAEEVMCYHCGEPCPTERFREGEKTFCCNGCLVVYQLIDQNNLCEYYAIEDHPGSAAVLSNESEYSYLNEGDTRKKLIEFENENFARLRLNAPAIHCSSCIWLLENLQRLNPGILRSEVNFTRKTVCVDFNPQKVKPGTVAGLLASIGYPPALNLENPEAKVPGNLSLVAKLGVAGFCFGNVMLFSFPEYLGLDAADEQLGRVFAWLNLALSIPVLIYSASGYFNAAIRSFNQRQINIDVPIAAGLAALFARSAWDIASGYGPGYLDSFTGLVFFLLIGHWFQARTYDALAFDRDFKSYFPLAVQKLQGTEWIPEVIFKLIKSDRIKIRNQEVVPADSRLDDQKTSIDYSFVTGESRPVPIMRGDKIFAGARVLGQPVVMTVEKETSQSHLTSLWNNDIFKKQRDGDTARMIDNAAKKFTWVVLGIAFVTAIVWYTIDPAAMWLVLTSVLMVACPCALALAAPFTYGSMLRVFGHRQLYLKNSEVVERLGKIDAVVFDKTGTLTAGTRPDVVFEGEISEHTLADVKLLCSFSTHPLSAIIFSSIPNITALQVASFAEFQGKGIEGTIRGRHYKLGSPMFVGFREWTTPGATLVFLSIDDEIRGHFRIEVAVRDNLKAMLTQLNVKSVSLLSGDGENDRTEMQSLFPPNTVARYSQQPQDKLEFIRELQSQGKRVLMIGDGLNDAGALKQADVGLAVTDNTSLFTPACDGILKGSELQHLHKFLSLARTSTTVLKAAFVISFCYNTIALGVAVTGHLTPLVAAVLMPVSSISVVGFSTLATDFISRNKFKST